MPPLESKSYELKETNYVALRETVTDPNSGAVKFPVTIIRQGMGNHRDKNYYSAPAIKSGEQVYEGKKAFFDHPTEEEEAENPNRSVKALFGHYENVHANLGKDGLMELNADLVPVQGPSRAEAVDLLKHAVDFKKKYPDKHFVGLSINGDGTGQTMPWDDFLKTVKPSPQELSSLKDIEGQDVNVITQLTDAVSADMVTEPGAGGGVKTKESNLKRRKRMKIKFVEAMKKYLLGIETDDKKLIEESQKALTEAMNEAEEGKKEKEAEEALSSEAAGALLKCMKQFKKENGQEKKESEEAYEQRCMQGALKMKKEADEKKEKESKEGGKTPPPPPPKKGAKGGEPAPSKDAGSGDSAAAGKAGDGDDTTSAGDDDDNEGEAQEGDKDPMKQMQAKMEKLEAKIESMEKEKEQNEKEGKAAQESAASAKTELEVKKRELMIEAKLAKCGQPRRISEHWKPLLAKAKTEKEMDEILEKMNTAANLVLEERFQIETSTGLIERQASASVGEHNDDLFEVKA